VTVKPATVKPSLATYQWEALSNNYSGRGLDADLNTSGRNGTVVQIWDCVVTTVPGFTFPEANQDWDQGIFT
jgi:hypothetical protein